MARPTEQLLTYSTTEIGRIVDVDPFTVCRWIDRGLLRAFRTPGRHRRVNARDLKEFLEARSLPIPEKLLEPRPPRTRLLIVDDQQVVLNTLRRAFRPWSNAVEVIATSSGVQALLLLGHEKPKGVLIDLCMPELDGIEVIRRVRKTPALAGIRLVAMSGHAPEEVRAAALRGGATACLEKPVDPIAVLGLVAPERSASWRNVTT